VAAAPQFHENHVFTGTFAFNLLMGRRWPAQPEDLQQAEALCRELGLGDLLDRMPAARALLQDTDLVVLDESLAALDPETFAQSLRCVLNRASTLLVIAHP
jgi:ABC-type Mn2+/Zn2+ transport system ATPase subunit